MCSYRLIYFYLWMMCSHWLLSFIFVPLLDIDEYISIVSQTPLSVLNNKLRHISPCTTICDFPSPCVHVSSPLVFPPVSGDHYPFWLYSVLPSHLRKDHCAHVSPPRSFFLLTNGRDRKTLPFTDHTFPRYCLLLPLSSPSVRCFSGKPVTTFKPEKHVP